MEGLITILIILSAIICWMTNKLPLTVALLSMMMGLVVCGIVSMEEACAALGSETSWMIMSMLMLSNILKKTALPERIAYTLLQISGKSWSGSLFALMTFCFILTFFIPSTVGKAVIVYPICIALCEQMKGKGNESEKVIVPAVLFVSTVGAFCTPAGSPTTFAAVELFETYAGYRWEYWSWAVAFTPVCAVSLFLFWLVLRMMNRDKETVRTGAEIKETGPVTKEERTVLILYGILFLLWGTKDMTGLSMAASTCLVMCMAFMPRISIMTWKEAVQSMDWDVILIMASSLSIAAAMKNSGLTSELTGMLSSLSGIFPQTVIVGVLILITVGVRLFFVNNVMMATIFLPVTFHLAEETGFNPVWLGMLVLQFINVSMFLPTQSVESIVIFGKGNYTKGDNLKLGSIIGAIMACVTISAAVFYWPVLGISVY